MEELVQIIGKEVVCTSREVAENFRKQHKNILRDIGGLLKNEHTKHMFKKTSYIEEQNGQEYPMYLINRDGFSLLVMGFTGKKALEWKLKYIQAFNLMEKKLTELQSEERLQARTQGKVARRSETDEIKKFIEYAKNQGSKNAENYYMIFSKLANSVCGVTDRNLATPEQLVNLAVTENIIRNSLIAGMVEVRYYKDLYQDVKARVLEFAAIAYIGKAGIVQGKITAQM